MNIVVEHKLNEEQSDTLREDLDRALSEVKEQLDKTFVGWERTKKVVSYTVVGVGVLSFAFGYFVGKSS